MDCLRLRLTICFICSPMFASTFFFFFQAEDGIRDLYVTGGSDVCSSDLPKNALTGFLTCLGVASPLGSVVFGRSEERRVGIESRSPWLPYHYTKKKRR